MIPIDEAKARAAAGAAELDRIDVHLGLAEGARWSDRIDVPTLDLRACSRCIFGQLYGLFSAAENHLPVKFIHLYRNPWPYGLDLDAEYDTADGTVDRPAWEADRLAGWANLTAAWIGEIAARRAPAAV